MIKNYFFNISFLLIVITLSAKAQDKNRVLPGFRNKIPYDSLKVAENNLNDENVVFPLNEDVIQRTNGFYDTLKTKSSKNRITSEFFNLILEDNNGYSETDEKKNEELFRTYENKIIRNIYFRRLPAFGPTINDTAAKPNLIVQKAGNASYVKTSEKTLEKNLIIEPGEYVDAFVLSDNERIFRMLPFIKDARILVKPLEGNSDSVDIEIVIKDVWPYGFYLDLSSVNKGTFGIMYDNLFGLGTEIQSYIDWKGGSRPLLGYQGVYKINNIRGSFINSDFRYLNSHHTVSYYADFQRSFLTPNIKYAGGIKFENRKTITDIEVRDRIYKDEPLKYTYYDTWIGRSFLLHSNNFLKGRTNIMFAGRYNHTNFSVRPIEVSPTYFQRYHDHDLLLFSLGISRQNYTKGTMIYSFGQIEDIPVGRMVQATAGYEYGEFKDRPYAGVSWSNGTFINKSQNYFYYKISLGSFIEPNSFVQGTFDYTAKYFTQLYAIQRFKTRYFVDLNYKYGINRFNDEYTSIEDNEGISGLRSDSLKGVQKLSLNFEAVSFSPLYLNGFRFAFFFFANVGLIGQSNASILSNKAYSGLGIGIRLRNEKLVFNTLQIRLAYYPVAPKDASWNYIQFSAEERLKFKNFYISEPDIIEF